MANSYYDVDCINEELGIYSVRKRAEDKTYYLTIKADGSWIHRCDAIDIYGQSYNCRHKKMIVQKFFASTAHKHLFNISPKRNNKKSGQSKST